MHGASSSLLGVLLGGALFACGGTPEIRVENQSSFRMEAVMVQSGGSDLEDFGDLDPAAFSDYREMEGAYRYGFVSAMVEGEKVELLPVDYVGEETLGGGLYTYRLSVLGTKGSFSLDLFTKRDD